MTSGLINYVNAFSSRSALKGYFHQICGFNNILCYWQPWNIEMKPLSDLGSFAIKFEEIFERQLKCNSINYQGDWYPSVIFEVIDVIGGQDDWMIQDIFGKEEVESLSPHRLLYFWDNFFSGNICDQNKRLRYTIRSTLCWFSPDSLMFILVSFNRSYGFLGSKARQASHLDWLNLAKVRFSSDW